jgi:hypothetical protein
MGKLFACPSKRFIGWLAGQRRVVPPARAKALMGLALGAYLIREEAIIAHQRPLKPRRSSR